MARNAALVFFVVVLTRLPFLGPGFGSDPDAWRIAGAARDIGRTGHYEASRFPGAPVVEIADAALLRLGPWALPLAGALWGAVGCAAFYVALCRLGVRGCFWAALALAFTPVFWIHTTDAMDYSWALGLALLSLALAVHGRAALAGALLGLAVGCRIATAVLVVPIGLLLERRGRFVGTFVLFCALALAPSFLTYGTRFLSGYEFGRVPWIYVLKGATRDVWGAIGSLVLALAFALALFRLRTVPRRELLAIVAAIGPTALVYLRLPHEGAYLLPLVPFVLLFLVRAFGKRGAVILAATLATSALLFGVVEKNHDPPPPRPHTAISPLGVDLTIVWLRGPFLEERAERTNQVEGRDRTVRWIRTLPPTDIVALYEELPVVQWVVPSGTPKSPTLVHLLDRQALDRAQREGRRIHWTAQSGEAEWKIYGTGPALLGPRY